VTGALNAMRHATGPLRDGHNLHFEYVLPTGSAGGTVLKADGYVVHELPFVEISRRKWDLLQYLPLLLLNGWRLQRLAARRGASIIHLNDFYNLTGYVAQLLSLGQLRVFTHVRFLPQTQVQPLARTWRWLAEKFADQVLCVSEAVRQYFGPAASVQVVYDPLPGLEKYAAPTLPQNRPDGTVHLLYLSNFIQGKGQNLALAAFAKAYAQQSNLRLHFAGGDMGMEKNHAFRRQLEAQAAAQGLAGIVTFSSFVADVEAVMKEADVILNFSESESFSLTCLDALFYGVPLIASDCGGPAELFEAGKSGLLVPNRDVPAMADAMVALAGNATLQQQFSVASRAFVRQKFASAHTYELLARCYQQALARP
jgi:glycosyltransferase involved in cell wall biosynthesis